MLNWLLRLNITLSLKHSIFNLLQRQKKAFCIKRIAIVFKFSGSYTFILSFYSPTPQPLDFKCSFLRYKYDDVTVECIQEGDLRTVSLRYRTMQCSAVQHCKLYYLVYRWYIAFTTLLFWFAVLLSYWTEIFSSSIRFKPF